MTDRSGFFAGLADTLTILCIYYVVVEALILNGGRWGVHLGWLLLWGVISTTLFTMVLKKPRGVPVLTALTTVLVLLALGLFILVSATELSFGYGFLMAVAAGVAVGMPLYYCTHRPEVMKHLTYLELLILTVLALLVMYSVLNIDDFTMALLVLVLFMDVAAAIGLRMSDGTTPEDGTVALRAILIALVGSAGLALVIGLFTLIFSHSGGVTDSLLHRIGAILASFGVGLQRVMHRLGGLLYHEESFEALDPGVALPGVSETEMSNESAELSISSTVMGGVLVAVVVIAVVAILILFRKQKVKRARGTVSERRAGAVRRSGGGLQIYWKRLCAEVKFRRDAVHYRNTPAGVFVWLERAGRRSRCPRQEGETMRGFLQRLDPTGGLDELATALDQQYYGGEKSASVSGSQCRRWRNYARKSVLKQPK